MPASLRVPVCRTVLLSVVDVAVCHGMRRPAGIERASLRPRPHPGECGHIRKADAACRHGGRIAYDNNSLGFRSFAAFEAFWDAAAENKDIEVALEVAFSRNRDGFSTFGAYRAFHIAHAQGLVK